MTSKLNSQRVIKSIKASFVHRKRVVDAPLMWPHQKGMWLPNHCGLWDCSNVFEGALARNQRSLFFLNLKILHSHTHKHLLSSHVCLLIMLFIEGHVSYIAFKWIHTHTVWERNAELAKYIRPHCVIFLQTWWFH